MSAGRPLGILLWCIRALLALVFVSASWAKLMGTPEMVALFSAEGVGQWFRYATAILELTGAVLIVVPKTRSIGAALLATIMLGALTVHLFILHVPPTTPVVLFVMSSVVGSPAGLIGGAADREAAEPHELEVALDHLTHLVQCLEALAWPTAGTIGSDVTCPSSRRARR
jgi:putative oxidoreductase